MGSEEENETGCKGIETSKQGNSYYKGLHKKSCFQETERQRVYSTENTDQE